MICLGQFALRLRGLNILNKILFILRLTFNTSLPSCLTSCSPLVAVAAELDSPAANKFLLTLGLGVIPTAGAVTTFPGFVALGATTSCSPLVAVAAELDSPAANKFLLTLGLGVIPTAGAVTTFPGFAALALTVTV